MRMTGRLILLVVSLALTSAPPRIGSAAAGAQRGGPFAGTGEFSHTLGQSRDMGEGQADQWREGDRRQPYLRPPWRRGRWLFWGAMTRARCGFGLARFPIVSDDIAIQTRQPEPGSTIAEVTEPAPPCMGLQWTDGQEGWNPPRPPAPSSPPAPASPEAPPAPPNW